MPDSIFSIQPPPLAGFDRPMPRNHQAEQALLGSMLLAPAETLADIEADLFGAFYDPAHSLIYKAIKGLNEKSGTTAVTFDLLMLSDELQRTGHLEEVGGRTYLAELMQASPTSANATHYAEIVLSMAVRRKTICRMYALLEQAYCETVDTGELLEEANRDLAALGQEFQLPSKVDTALPIREGMNETVGYLEEVMENKSSVMGYSTGYPDLDKYRRLVPGEMYVIAARPSIGKTALGLNIAANLAIGQNVPALVFSIEMSRAQLQVRALTSCAGVGVDRFKEQTVSASDWEQVMDACHKLNSAPLYIDDTTRHIESIRAVTRRMVADHGVRVVVVDYLQIVRLKERIRNRSRENEVAEMSALCKAIAKDMPVSFVVMAQLNRQAEGLPQISHLRESGAIENDADVITLLHRDRSCQMGDAQAIVAKNRNGSTGIAELVFDASTTTFHSKSRISDSDIPSQNQNKGYAAPGSAAHMQQLRSQEQPI